MTHLNATARLKIILLLRWKFVTVCRESLPEWRIRAAAGGIHVAATARQLSLRGVGRGRFRWSEGN